MAPGTPTKASAEPVNIYDPERPCPKCGTNHSTTKHLTAHHLPTRDDIEFMGKWYYPNPRDYLPLEEHMSRTCHHCGHVWAERPVDWDELIEESA